ncbi:MAG TPA: hypothetical protein VK997_08210 [Deferrisomatales bacterium]|nr:hypothetical protein [Deferrisomatales bacterium]
MDRGRVLGVLLTAMLVAAGCETGQPPPGRGLADTAAALDAELGRVREATVTLAVASAERFADPSGYATPRFPDRRYRTFEGALTYYQGGPEESAVLLSQPTPAGEAALGQMRLLEHLDGALRQVVATSPLVAMAWVATGDSAVVFFPPFDLVAYVPTGVDVPRDILPYQVAAPASNPGRGPVWVEPYVDMCGKGYMVTVSAPVYRGPEMVAVAAADVAVAGVVGRFLPGNAEELRLLLTASGFLAGATEPAGRALGIEALGRFSYLDQVQRDAPAPARFNLVQHTTAEVRELATRVLAGESSFPLPVGERRYRVATAAVPVAGWHLVELREVP